MLAADERQGRLGVSVASVTTAFNAIRLLPRHIEALLSQTRPLQEIIVIDNGSVDGTGAMLAERYPQVTVLRMPQNLGAAGGWAEGLRYAALEKGHDWVWTFDDDSVPGSNALQALLEGIRDAPSEPEIGMAVPLPVNETTGIPYPPLLWDEGFVKPADDLVRRPLWFADLAITSGSLLRRGVVSQIGLPRAEFFMDFFDFEYCLRMRSRGFRIAVVTGCRFAHEIGNARNIRLPGFNRLWPDYAPWREYYLSRNMVYAGWHLYPTRRTKRFIRDHLLRHAAGVVLFGTHKPRALMKMLQGAQDGRKGRLGIRFLPG